MRVVTGHSASVRTAPGAEAEAAPALRTKREPRRANGSFSRSTGLALRSSHRQGSRGRRRRGQMSRRRAVTKNVMPQGLARRESSKRRKEPPYRAQRRAGAAGIAERRYASVARSRKKP